MENIVLCYPVSDSDRQRIEREAPQSRIITADQQTIGEAIFQADIYCGHAKVPLDWTSVVQQGRLRWIQSSAAGLDHCLVAPVLHSDIAVSGCSGLFANQVAEQTMALLYGCVRRMPAFMQAQQQRRFQRQEVDMLHGKSVAIAGFGCNGRRIADLLQPVASSIVATDVFYELEAYEGVELLPPAELNRLFERADVVIATLPLTPDTVGCMGRQQFSIMKPGSYFINVGRGGLVNHAELLSAIQHQSVAYAGLDVVDPEPLPQDDPLWDCDRVLITPHIGAMSPGRMAERDRTVLSQFTTLSRGTHADQPGRQDIAVSSPRKQDPSGSTRDHRLAHGMTWTCVPGVP